ncbi:3-hexulose-6-phosphate synthase [Lachnospiraceae bacterium ZAX-1]
MPKLQLAIDDLNYMDALKLMQQIQPYVDIIELGSPFIMEYGMEAVRNFRKQFPNNEILADLKIMDAGYYEAELAFKAGADYVTVLGVTDLLTIKGCQEAANAYGKNIYVDMICVEDLLKRMKEVESIGVHGISVHIGIDQQAAGKKPIDDLKIIVKHRTNTVVSVAGGIKSSTIPMYIAAKADVVIAGGGICHCQNPTKEAELISKLLKEGKETL